MSETEQQLDIHNLSLKSNEFTVLEEGDYRFKVVGFSVEYSQGSEKIPPNTQQIVVECEIPSANGVATVKNYLTVYPKYLFLIRRFSEAVGLCEESGDFTLDVDALKGKEGICHLTVETSARGNDYNRMSEVFPPSKRPTVTDNDEYWDKYLKDKQAEIDKELEDMPF